MTTRLIASASAGTDGDLACRGHGRAPGDGEATDSYAGQLMFVDPRVDACCGIRLGSVTTPQLPLMAPGTMILFPSPFVHCVNPYRGRRLRITLAWDRDRDAIPGSPLADLRD